MALGLGTSAVGRFKFDDQGSNGRSADIFGLMRHSRLPKTRARGKVDNLHLVADPDPDVGGGQQDRKMIRVRMNAVPANPHAWLAAKLQDANPIIIKADLVAVGLDSGGVLGVRGDGDRR